MKNNEFNNWILRTAIGEYEAKKQRIIDELKITDPIFRNWRLGITEVPYIYKKALNEMFKKKIFKLK